MNLFNSIKQSHSTQFKTSHKPNQKLIIPFFQLDHDEFGSYIQVVDKKGKILQLDYRQYSGTVRDVLKILQDIEKKNSMVINWDNPAEHLYLSDNEFLIWHLKFCQNVVDKDFKAIIFSDDVAHIQVSITQSDNENELNVSMLLRTQRGEQAQSLLSPQFITESYVMLECVIYRIEPIGEKFASLSFFSESFFKIDLEKYLSLLYSHFSHIKIDYNDYKEILLPEKKTTPCIIIEKIDEDNSLYLRTAQSVAEIDADFLSDYDINTVVNINDMERSINRSILIDGGGVLHTSVQKLLNQYKRKTGSKKQVSDTPSGSNFYIEDDLFIIEEVLARELIYKALPELMQQYTVFGVDKLTSYKVKSVAPKLRLSMGFGIDFLEGDVELDVEGEVMGIFDVLQQYRKNAYITLSDGSHALLNQSYIKKLERLFKKQKGKSQQAKISFFDLPLIDELIEEKTSIDNVANNPLARSREIFSGFNKLRSARMPKPKVDAKLRDYQTQGYKWLNYLHKHSLGGCLADDMGLGKTLQAIALLSTIYPKEKLPSLIAMPKSLLLNWQNEINKFCPGLSHYIYYGNQRDLSEACKHHLVLTTYGMVRSDIEHFKEVSFHYVILDESQQIKNVNSQINKAVMLLDTQHRLALSGTPIENSLTELYSLFRFLNPSMFGSLVEFNRYYATPIQQNGDKTAARELKSKVYPFILRRLKKDVLKDLPDKIEQHIYVDMSPEQERLYTQRRLYYAKTINEQVAQQGIKKSQFFILQAMTELRQIASTPEAMTDGQITSPKREILHDYLSDSIANGHKSLIFVNYLSAIDLIGSELQEQAVPYLSMTGATANRQVLVDQFQQDTQIKVLLMTLKTGGVGLNLTAADTIFIFDPWWNLAAENQAIDRAHRMGQDKTVFSYKLITRNTIEEKIMQLQEKKSELFDSVIGTDSASIKSLDENDLNFILS